MKPVSASTPQGEHVRQWMLPGQGVTNEGRVQKLGLPAGDDFVTYGESKVQEGWTRVRVREVGSPVTVSGED